MQKSKKYYKMIQDNGASFPGAYASDTPSTSRMRATPAKIHLAGGSFVLS
jgi:hypothetical protein